MLPEDVFPYVNDSGEKVPYMFYTVYDSKLSEDELKKYLTYKKLSYIKTIKKCAVYFAALSASGIIASVFTVIYLYNVKY